MNQFLGQILAVAFNFAPKNWTTCSAQILSIQQNAALFSLLGTTYGGNGVTTFALPDLRGRAANNWGQGPGLQNYVLGEMTGTATVTMLASNVPLHIHSLLASNQAPGTASPSGADICAGGSLGGNTANLYGTAAGSTLNSGTIAAAGQSTPIPIMQPYTVLQYCIALQGIFPSRN
ncbi:microcystin-dependent protein [Mucilaginibacter yixingensis]|uniref:Microcystin-dependent protein n=1 Tax=Mucilaginibacter yixingensis TaxID=1295612 RepID=A0A2T5JG94_9SPHI|nr:tail fiber protein [Mucilaginibacter yixingensis]PTR01414.1 microcystin-dependent protein [Mucilaginibacter yixingensis]